jgi:hypothetical protein
MLGRAGPYSQMGDGTGGGGGGGGMLVSCRLSMRTER